MEKINITELLRNCPKGMELDCMIYDDVYFDYIDELNIIHCYIQHDTHKTSITFNQYGTPNSDIKSKCVIFPKGKTTWKGFYRPFKDGDVIYNKDINALAIFYKQTDASTISYCFLNVMGELRIHHYHSKDLSDWKFATEEEKEKLFKVIKDKGYHWNDETKTLEKLHKFKVGDRVKHISAHTPGVVLKVWDKGYYIDLPKNGGVRYISFELEKDYELLPDKFDINTLVPFEDKVLVRNAENQKWVPAFWGYKVADGFVTTFGWCKYCIPYKGNEILFKTNNDCDDYFKTWQE